MEWNDPERTPDGSFQSSREPAGYCVTYATTADKEHGVFMLSYRNQQFGRLYVEKKDRKLAAGMARGARALCGLHNIASQK